MTLSLQTSTSQPVEIKSPFDENRQQWIQLLTLGTLKTVDERGPFFVDDPEAVIRESFRNISTDKLPVDYDHAIDVLLPRGMSAPAAGWISCMEVRSDGIWGLVEWTPKAAQQIRDKEYRFLSPVIGHCHDKKVSAILRAALTNLPNLTLKSLNTAEKGLSMDHEQFMSDLRAALGLPATADEQVVLDAIKISKSTNSADPAKFVPLATFQQTVSELNKLRSGVSLQSAEREVENHVRHGRLLPFMRDWAVSLCQANKSAFDEFMDGAGKPVGEFITSLQSPAADWGKFHKHDGKIGEMVSEVHRNLGHTADDLKVFNGKTEQ
jgi:phage I-like protein